MSWNGWDTDAAGNIQVTPAVGWKTAIFSKGMSGGLRIEFATDPSLTNVAAVQVVMGAPQVRELANALITMADRMEMELGDDSGKRAAS